MLRRLFLTLLAVCCAACASTRERTDLDRFLRETVRAFPETPALSVAVVRDGRPLLANGYGSRDVARKLPMRSETPVYIASSTKAYTGLLLAILAQRGVVDLDTAIVKYFPELDAWSDAHRITLRMLLTHSAGIANDPIVVRTAFSGEYTPAQLIELLAHSQSIPQKFKYGNLGYVVAALAGERATGRRWQELMDEIVFAPLGMTQTTTRVRDLGPGYESGRTAALELLGTRKTDATMYASGGIVTTANDLARWLAANVNDSGAAFAAAHEQQVAIDPVDFYRFRRTGYTLGWYVSDFDGALLLHDLGSFPGWRAHVSFLPSHKIGVAVVTNTSGLGAEVVDYVAAQIYDRLLGKPDTGAARAAEMHAQIVRNRQRLEADLARRAARPPTLTRPASAYAGAYVSPLYGTLTVEQHEGAFVAHLGAVAAPLEPFTAPDTARVELDGGGEVVRFVFANDGDRATTLVWKSAEFARMIP